MIKDFPQELKDLKKWLICYNAKAENPKSPKYGFIPINEPDTLIYFKDIKTDERYKSGDLIGLSMYETLYFVLDLDNHIDKDINKIKKNINNGSITSDEGQAEINRLKAQSLKIDKMNNDILEMAKAFNLLVTKSASGRGFHIYGKFDSMKTKEKASIGKPEPELLKNKYACENPKCEIINKVDSLPTNGKDFLDEVKKYIGFNEPQDTKPAPDLSYLKDINPSTYISNGIIDYDYMINEINKNDIDFLPLDGCGKGFVCPICGSGSHSANGTGLKRNNKRSDKILYTCFGKCGGDKGRERSVFDYLIAKHGFFNPITCEVLKPEPTDLNKIITDYANSHGITIKNKDTSVSSQAMVSNPKPEPSNQPPINNNSGLSNEQIDFNNLYDNATVKAFFDNDEIIKYQKAQERIPTGLIDDLLNGGLPIGLTILGAVTNIGKTTFISQLSECIANNGNYVLFFSYEMQRGDLIFKGLLRTLYKEYGKNKVNGKDKLDDDNINKYLKFIDNNYIIFDYKNFTGLQKIENIKKICETFKDKVDKENQENKTNKKIVVFIDYLQKIQVGNITDERLRTNKILDNLLIIANTLDLSIFAISSLNRKSYYNTVDLTSFKESGQIEYDSEYVLGMNYKKVANIKVKKGDNDKAIEQQAQKIHNKEAQKDIKDIELSILKVRNSKMNPPKTFKFIGKYGLFVDIDTIKPDDRLYLEVSESDKDNDIDLDN